MTHLTETQETILLAASQRLDGNIEPLPSRVNAGLRPRVIEGLMKRELVTLSDEIYRINAKGFEAIGATMPATAQASTHRQVTKQTQVIALLERPEGATIEDICTETGWQAHTVRGLFSSTLKKRLGLNLISSKAPKEPRRYCIARTEGDTK